MTRRRPLPVDASHLCGYRQVSGRSESGRSVRGSNSSAQKREMSIINRWSLPNSGAPGRGQTFLQRVASVRSLLPGTSTTCSAVRSSTHFCGANITLVAVPSKIWSTGISGRDVIAKNLLRVRVAAETASTSDPESSWSFLKKRTLSYR